MTVKTRFAPSPTGYLHIGGVRTALFSWLYARRHNGSFILRIEDTDRERSTDESVQIILDGMDWLGLEADEGPYFQTQRFDRYKEVIEQLLAQGDAYYCYCSRDELDAMREAQREKGEKPRYDRRCRFRTAPEEGVEPVVRFKNPDQGVVVINDLIKGRVVIANDELDDLIIARSDGTPTYNLTVVVDDLDMGVTHVIRGDDHLNNTPRQINMLKALGAEPPIYAHAPMILGADGSRLSKRHGAVNVLDYREQGYLPEALLNYLVRLGWSHGDQEIFSVEEMIEYFDPKDVNKSDSTFNPEKLLWLNQHYLKALPAADIAERVKPFLQQIGVDVASGPPLEETVEALREKAKTLKELAEHSVWLYRDALAYPEQIASKHFSPKSLEALLAIRDALTGLETWEPEALHAVVKQTVEALGVKFGQLAMPLRMAVTGGSPSPSIDLTLYLAGRERVLARLQDAINIIENNA